MRRMEGVKIEWRNERVKEVTKDCSSQSTGSMVESSKVAEKGDGTSSFQTSTKTPLVASILESLRKNDKPSRGPPVQQPTQTFNRFEPLMGGEGADTQETVREADKSESRMDEPAMESLNPSNERKSC
ncbi:hypothetical protein L6452_09251 [Arctium lappa]|uniref:Uncharacterized protein n=1 Tax=Arctium lappa TaxID=4217 RepID=A0ACB9DJZ0_ARCLA|nr:hypothetical protein L6452_09251 [Arctium lappa]